MLIPPIPTWVNGTSDDSAQWIPSPVIKPVVELVESFLCEETGGAVVEVSEGDKKGVL